MYICVCVHVCIQNSTIFCLHVWKLQAHPWLTDFEREQICRLMNCQKLSLEASTHAAQNERLPLRVIVQVLFFEQLRLRTSISGWFFVSDNLENSQNHEAHNEQLSLSKSNGSHQVDHEQDRPAGIDDVRDRVFELEKEYQSMKEDIQKLVKTKRGWNIFCRRRSHHCNSKSSSKPSCNGKAPPVSSVTGREKKNEEGELGCWISWSFLTSMINALLFFSPLISNFLLDVLC